jgi:hypothetical protein
MLNELYDLSVVLEHENIFIYEWHKDLKPLPNPSEKKPCYRILITSDGSINDIEPINPELVSSLRKWEPKGNGNSFPGFNIQPLYRVTDEEKKKLLKKWREGREQVDLSIIKKWCAHEQIKNWDAKFGKKMNKCLREIPQELQKRSEGLPADFASLQTLCERVAKWWGSNPEKFFLTLESFLWNSLEKGVRSLLPMLIHEGSPRALAEKDRGSVSVFLDVPDWQEYPVGNKKTIRRINECLLIPTNTSDTKPEDKRKDAFGRGIRGEQDKLPEVKLPYIGTVKLRAMTSESPCQFRYKTIDAVSFHIGAQSRKRTKGALEWLGCSDREGETWGRADDKELLFAYPTIIPKIPVKVASCLGALRRDDTEARFAQYAEDVVNCLKGLNRPLKDIELRVFSLRKMDKARTKVVFHRNYSAQRLADAAREWQQGCANIPVITIKSWGDEKGKPVLVEPKTPFPLQVSDCLNRIWKLNGTTRDEVKYIPKSKGIELLLNYSADLNQAPHLLTVALQNGKGLFLSLGHSLHRDEILGLQGFNSHKQLMPALLGLLLWKLGIRKEIYMNNGPYLVGRILKLADELHALYCKEVRNGSLPPQLLGNALVGAALNSPIQSLAQLSLRIVPYLGWARTNSTDSAGLSRYFLKEFGNVESKLRDFALPTRLDDPARAQLLLGYISSYGQTDAKNN